MPTRFNFSDQRQTVDLPFAGGPWKKLIDTGVTMENDQIALPPSSFGVFQA
jgi:hypothetical protein